MSSSTWIEPILGVQPLQARLATPQDAAAITTIYNEGIAERIATFETRARSTEEIVTWFDDNFPLVVVEDGDKVIAFASTSQYRPRECYRGVAEFSVYVARSARKRRFIVSRHTWLCIQRWQVACAR